jgi:S-formylglutathione hydrolase FrmB
MAGLGRVGIKSFAAVLFLSVGALTIGHAGQPLQGPGFEERRRGDLSTLTYPGGSEVQFSSLSSKTLGADQPFSIFLPPSFKKETSRRYPVVYFLHGLNNDQTSWTVPRYGDLPQKVEDMIVAGRLPEFIMVHPRGDNSFYCNTADGSKRYEDFVVQELPAYIESHYRARQGRQYRSIGGTSMGGYGALKIAMKFPERYAATAGHSPIIFLGRNPLDVPDEMKASRFYGFFVSILKPILGDPVQQSLWDANNPLLLAKSGKMDGLKILFDYGTEDRYIQSIHLDQGIRALDQDLTEANVPHILKVYPGEPHGWALVASHLQESMTFLCQTFN